LSYGTFFVSGGKDKKKSEKHMFFLIFLNF